MEHEFTPTIMRILQGHFGDQAEALFDASLLIQYLNLKTRSASRGSKSRSSFGNIYALYVLAEDYVKKKFHKAGNYQHYEGARFSDLFQRQRQLPFGRKLQNHHLNHRLNEEFHKFFPTCEFTPILRDVGTKRYWVNENLLRAKVGKRIHSVAVPILEIVDAYMDAKKGAFLRFLSDCKSLLKLEGKKPKEVERFIVERLEPNVDARVFEIVSYAILKEYFGAQTIF